MLIFIDVLINFGLAIFIGIKTQSIGYSVLFLASYAVVTCLVKSIESKINVPGYFILLVAKESLSLLVTALFNFVIDLGFSLFKNSAKKGLEMSYIDKESIDRAPNFVAQILNPSPDTTAAQVEKTESLIHQLETYSNGFGLTALELTIYVYLCVKVVWLLFKVFQASKNKSNTAKSQLN